jgi:hypothetical protein
VIGTPAAWTDSLCTGSDEGFVFVKLSLVGIDFHLLLFHFGFRAFVSGQFEF